MVHASSHEIFKVIKNEKDLSMYLTTLSLHLSNKTFGHKVYAAVGIH